MSKARADTRAASWGDADALVDRRNAPPVIEIQQRWLARDSARSVELAVAAGLFVAAVATAAFALV